MGAGWCKRYSKNCGADTSLQDMMTKWADRIGNGSEEPRWYKKWTRRRPNKWKDRPEISAPCLINPCFLEGTKWDNVILSVPDPEMKSRIPVAPPRRKRKRKPLGRDRFSGGLAIPDDDQNPQVYQTISSPYKSSCLNIESMNSMSLSSLSGPLTPSNRHRSFSCELQSRRMSLDSDYDCSLSSRTSLASIPVTNELYRKQHFLFSASDHNFNMTQASTYSATNSLSKKTQTQKRRRLLQNITKKYNLTLSLPSLNCVFSKHLYNKNVGSRYLDRHELGKFYSLPDLIHCSGDLSKEATVYATLYGIKREPRYNLRHKTSTYGKGIKSLRKINSGDDHRSFLKAGFFQNRQGPQMNLMRGLNNLEGTANGLGTSISEDHEECIAENPTRDQDQEREPRNLRLDRAEKLKDVSESNFSQRYRTKIDFVRGNNALLQTERTNNTRNSNRVTENFISCTEKTRSELNDEEQNSLSNSKSHAPEEYHRNGGKIDKNNSSPDSISIAEEQEINQSNTITLNKVETNLCLSSISAARTEWRNSHTCCSEAESTNNISREKSLNDDGVEKQRRSTDLETKQRAEWLKLWSGNFDKSNKENLDGNLLSKHNKTPSKFRTAKCLKTFRRLSQRQSFVDKVGCPLFFDKHHSCSCLRPRGQRFQSMSAISSEKYNRPQNLRNGLIKKSLSVNHSQQGRKTDHGFKSSHCDSAVCCNNTLQGAIENNNNSKGMFPESHRVGDLPFRTKETDVNSNITLELDESERGLMHRVKLENSNVFEDTLSDRSQEVFQNGERVNNFKNELTSGRVDTSIGPHRSVIKITDSTSDKSRRSSTSDSLCELENDIYDMLTVSSINQQAAGVKDL